MAAGAAQFLSLAGWIEASHDGMIVAEPVAAKDVLPVGLIRMTILAYLTALLGQKTRGIRRMRIVAGQTTAAGHRGMDIGIGVVRLIMALVTKFGDRGSKRELAFFLCMRGRVAGRASLVRARILTECGVDDPFPHDFFVAVEAGLLCSGLAGEKTEAYAAGEKDGDMHLLESHAAL